jgi:hypothetical protein
MDSGLALRAPRNDGVNFRQLVGLLARRMVERSDTHQSQFVEVMGFAKGSTQSYELRNGAIPDCAALHPGYNRRHDHFRNQRPL